MKTLDTELLAEVTARLVAEFHPEQIILLGSHTWGTPDEDSDFDLMIIVPESRESPYRRVVRAYRALPIGRVAPIDILAKTRAEFDRFRHLRASLEHQIVEQGRIIYG